MRCFGAIALCLLLTDSIKEPVLRVPCRVIEVVDGDTVTVEIILKARVRLLDCWAPERNTSEGQASKDNMIKLAQDKEAILEIELANLRRLDDAFSFGRILGRIYVDNKDLSELSVRKGYAKATKGE